MKKLTPLEEALDLILAQVKPVTQTVTVALPQALGSVLAEAVISPISVPPVDNSAMDGYAVNTNDLTTGSDQVFPVSQRIPAGSNGDPLKPGSVARIFTGAPVPANADAVVMQENCEQVGEGEIRIQGEVTTGMNIRSAGEDIMAGHIILPPGQRLRPQELGLAASVGVAELTVCKPIKVATFFTGDELTEPGQALAPGKIYNSNRYVINGLLQMLGCEVIDKGAVADNLEATREALIEAHAEADLVITSGGVSVGEEDWVRVALQALGKLNLWQIAIKPGKPLAFGEVDQTPFFGLPGNPVSAFFTFLLFVRPFILRMQGVEDVTPKTRPVIAAFDWPKPGPRREFLRARLDTLADGTEQAVIYSNQSSGVLTSTSWADGLVIVPEGQTVKTGDKLTYMSIAELLSG